MTCKPGSCLVGYRCQRKTKTCVSKKKMKLNLNKTKNKRKTKSKFKKLKMLSPEDKTWFEQAILMNILEGIPNTKQAIHFDKNAKITTGEDYYDLVFNYAQEHQHQLSLKLFKDIILKAHYERLNLFMTDEDMYNKYFRYYFDTLDDITREEFIQLCNEYFSLNSLNSKMRPVITTYNIDFIYDIEPDVNDTELNDILYNLLVLIATIKMRLLNKKSVIPITKEKLDAHIKTEKIELIKIRKKILNANERGQIKYYKQLDKLDKKFISYLNDIIKNVH
jgi:hypothetical protein